MIAELKEIGLHWATCSCKGPVPSETNLGWRGLSVSVCKITTVVAWNVSHLPPSDQSPEETESLGWEQEVTDISQVTTVAWNLKTVFSRWKRIICQMNLIKVIPKYWNGRYFFATERRHGGKSPFSRKRVRWPIIFFCCFELSNKLLWSV